MLPRIGLDLRAALADPGVRRVLRQMVPATFAVSVAQISLIINTNIASRLACGSVSWITYADRLMEFPTALLGVALGTVLLPHLSHANAEGDGRTRSPALLDWGMRLTFLLALPSSVALWLLAVPLTATLFHYGRFTRARRDRHAARRHRVRRRADRARPRQDPRARASTRGRTSARRSRSASSC